MRAADAAPIFSSRKKLEKWALAFHNPHMNHNTEPLPYRESRTRSILKGLTWRVLATTTTVLIAWFIGRDVKTALTIGGIEFFAKFFIYYMHERAWQSVPRGKIRSLRHKEA